MTSDCAGIGQATLARLTRIAPTMAMRFIDMICLQPLLRHHTPLPMRPQYN
jgi:hypothetical protein